MSTGVALNYQSSMLRITILLTMTDTLFVSPFRMGFS